MILSGNEIRNHLGRNIIIDPFDEKNLNPNSYNLSLHDELLVHVPVDHRMETARVLEACLDETARRWSPAAEVPVRFVADVSVIDRWSDAK